MKSRSIVIMENLHVIKEQLLAYEIDCLLSHNQHCWPVRIPLPSAVKQQI